MFAELKNFKVNYGAYFDAFHRKIKKSDSGLYRCWAVNSLGETPSQCIQSVYENIEVVKVFKLFELCFNSFYN